MTVKVCTSCKKEKPLEAFNRKAPNPDGLQYHCKDCRRDAQAVYRAKHGEEINRKARQWRKESPKWRLWWARKYPRIREERRKYNRAYYQKRKYERDGLTA